MNWQRACRRSDRARRRSVRASPGGVASTTADEGKYDELLVIEGFDPGKAKAFR